MIGLNRKEKEQLILNLYNNGSSYREIAKEARVSLRDIKGILDKANGVQSLSKSSQAYRMFSEGKSPTDVAIALDMSKEAGLNSEHVVRILKLADYDLSSLERRYYNLKSEVKSLEAKKESLIRIIQDYDNQVMSLGKSFDSYCRLCQEEHKLTDLQRKRLQAEALVSHFENSNKEYVKIRSTQSIFNLV